MQTKYTHILLINMSADRKFPSLVDDSAIEIHPVTDELELSSSEDEDQVRRSSTTPEAIKVATAIPKAAAASKSGIFLPSYQSVHHCLMQRE